MSTVTHHPLQSLKSAVIISGQDGLISKSIELSVQLQPIPISGPSRTQVGSGIREAVLLDCSSDKVSGNCWSSSQRSRARI